MPAECLSGSAIELVGHSVKLSLSDPSQALTLGKVLAEESVGVLVAAPLPWTSWVAKEDLDAGVDGELNMLRPSPDLGPKSAIGAGWWEAPGRFWKGPRGPVRR